MDSNLPIDIQLKKMSDWLISRRICNRNWHDKISEVREKIAAAITDMPEHPEIKDILTATNIHYFNCQAILKVLLETEKGSKNILGIYTSQRISDWRKIISLYEKDNCYLAEASQFLSQSVQYEIPGLRKERSRHEKNITESDKLEQSTQKKASEMLAQRKAECSSIGIQGSENPKKEILDIVGNLPKLYEGWIQNARKSLPKSIEQYQNIASEHRDPSTCLPTVTFLLKHGNVTAYEFQYGEAPLKIDEPNLFHGGVDEPEDVEGVEGGEICLDLDSLDLETNLDDGGTANCVDEQVIDWGDIAVEESVIEGGIDWGAVDDLATEIVIEDSGIAAGVASGIEAYCILDNRRLRNMVIDELNELSSFCKMRSIERSQEKNFFLNDNLLASNEENSNIWMASHNEINSLIDELNGPGTIRTLHLVKTSTTFVNRIVSELQHKIQVADRLEKRVESIRAKRQETLNEVDAVQKNCSRVLKKTVLLQEHIEKDLSKRYNNRKVNILGGVQSL